MRLRWKIVGVLGLLAAFVTGFVAGNGWTSLGVWYRDRELHFACMHARTVTFAALFHVRGQNEPATTDIVELLTRLDERTWATTQSLHWWCPECGAPYLVRRSVGAWSPDQQSEEPAVVCTGVHRHERTKGTRAATTDSGSQLQLNEAAFAELLASGRYRMLAEGYRPPPAERAKKPRVDAKE
jgi:hypothetical protein